MHRTFFNLFLIIAICFLASIMPMNTALFEFPEDLIPNFTLSKPSTDIQTVNISYKTNSNESQLYNPTSIEFIMTGRFDKGPFILGDSHDMILEAFTNDNLVKKYSNTEFVTGLVDTNNKKLEVKFLFDLSKENLGLQNGNYKFKIYSTGDIFTDTPPYEIFVNYLGKSKYIPAKNTVEDDKTYVTLYFPDGNHEYLIPVSRKISNRETSIRKKTIDNLILGPSSSLGLSSGSPIPEVPRIWVSQGLANLYLPRDIGIYDEYSSAGGFALNSFINTLTSLDEIDKIKFFKGGREVETLFHERYVKEPFEKNDSPKVYLGLETTTERILLAPIELEESNGNIDKLVPKIFNSLKTAMVNENHHGNLLPTIPASIKLLNYKYSNNILTLNFSKDFYNSYGERSDIQKMMLDSILYSFTSIPEVTTVAITVNDNTVNTYSDIDISKPLTAPRFINTEEK